MQDCFEVVPLPRILRVKELEELDDKLLRNVFCHHLIRDNVRHHEFQEQLVDELEMRPCLLKMGFVLIWISQLMLFVIYKQTKVIF